MYPALSPGAVQVSAPNLEAALAAAQFGDFEGVEVNPHEIADRIDAKVPDAVRALFQEAGVRPCGFGLPGDFWGDLGAWQNTLDDLPRLAAAMSAIGCDRSYTWILSFSNDLDYPANFQFHVDRLQPAAQIFADYGIRLGLEFLGPQTIWRGKPHEFIHSSAKMMELAKAIGSNVGLLLDAWHWYTAKESPEDLAKLTNRDVVYVHVSDAPSGIALEDQLDNVRCLPGETDVIPIGQFMDALRAMKYDGPVIVEPFKKELADLPDDAARIEAVRESLMNLGFFDSAMYLDVSSFFRHPFRPRQTDR
jgi:sugar phosphate isomerase/epimerase